MDEFCFEPGLSRQDVDSALAEFPFGPSDAPVIGLGGECGRVMFASRGMLNLFQLRDLDALTQRLHGADPGARRLLELAANLPVGGAQRLERLRFFFGPTVETFTFLCRRLAGRDSPLFIATALNVRPALLRAPVAVAAAGPQQADPAEPSRPSEAMEVEAADHPEILPASRSEPLSAETVRATLAERFGTDRVRFVWRTDAENRISEITSPLVDVVGATAADLVGRNFEEVVEELGLDPSGRLAEMFARHETWSGLEVAWPIAGAAATVAIALGGLPAFDREHRFEGYRGFGVAHIERVTAAEPCHLVADADIEETSPPTQHQEEPEADDGFAPPLAAAATFLEGANVVPLRPLVVMKNTAIPRERPTPPESDKSGLSDAEQNAFRQIAMLLSNDDEEPSAESLAPVLDAEAERPALAYHVIPDTEQADRIASAYSSPEPAEAPTPTAPVSEATDPVASVEPGAVPSQLAGDAFAILDRMGMGLLVSSDDTALYANRYLLELLGYADLHAFQAAGGMASMFDQYPAHGNAALDLRTRVGEVIGVNARLQSIEWDQKPATLLSLKRIDEDKLRAGLETELHRYENEARELNAILDTATDGVAVLDAEGRILALNRSGEALFGYDQTEVAGEFFTVLVAGESQAKAQDYFDGLKANGVMSLLNDGREIMGRARQGGLIPMFMTLGRISAGDGDDRKYCALLRDMTHWKKVEQELEAARREAERANALKSDFLAKVSHEVRTPLNAILGFAEVIMEERFGPVGNERYKDYLKDIHASGEHLMSLVNDLLDLSKIEAGKMDLDFVPVDANGIISDCVSIMQPQANRERVIMRLSLAPHLPQVYADERSLKQIVLNILSNAVKFNEPGGQVIVATTVTDVGHAVIRIRDTGIGMSEDDIGVALEPFRQLATSRASTGTGLGLPLTKALVEANHAFFSIKSKKREGTMVEVAFPPARVLAE